MGCSYDVIKAKIKKKEYAKLFIEKFAEELKYDFYMEDDFDFSDPEEWLLEENGWYYFGLYEEPVFAQMLGGHQLDQVVLNFAKENPDAEFEVRYEGTYNNCGEYDIREYFYKDGKVILKETHGEGGDYCEECESDFDVPLCWNNEPNDDGKYLCPECGTVMEMDYSKEVYEIPLVDGEWTIPEEAYIFYNDKKEEEGEE